MDKIIREDNPFEDEVVAKEWINSRENEADTIRHRELEPFLKDWVKSINPKIIVEIGSGQGILADTVQPEDGKYVGVEPSKFLLERAKEKYPAPNREFILGNAYSIPLPDEYTDVVFSVNVWFHLKDLDTASKELARILKSGGSFLVSTGNPEADKIWESFFVDYKKEGRKLDGKIKIPINPLSRNVFFLHTLDEIISSLENAGLTVKSTNGFGYTKQYKDEGLFINIEGRK